MTKLNLQNTKLTKKTNMQSGWLKWKKLVYTLNMI